LNRFFHDFDTGRRMSEQGSQLAVPGTQAAECPRCHCHVPFRRSHDPVIDACGFESYTLSCPGCGRSFSGIIDPYDDAFLAEVLDEPTESAERKLPAPRLVHETAA
jgi:hypothetical protein